MKKWKKIVYWIATVWLSVGMLSSGIVQLLRMQKEVDLFASLGYPVYFLTLLGVWKIFGVIATLLPRFTLVKEWAYAGFFLTMSGAAVSHIACGHGFIEIFPTLLLLLLTIVSWYFRPDRRRIVHIAKWTV